MAWYPNPWHRPRLHRRNAAPLPACDVSRPSKDVCDDFCSPPDTRVVQKVLVFMYKNRYGPKPF